MVLSLALALALSAEMSDAHRKWIEEEVVYIITDREKEVFLELQTVEERDRFIEAFWSRRDPNPATPRNEFREEHHRRIDYANQFLGRDTFRPGWRTDRGRYFILLGEPRTIERFSGGNEIVDSELWFYQGGGERGLPGAFFLLFFQRDGVGEFELYHPIADGPTSLFRTAGMLPGQDDLTAVEKLEQLSADLAHASLSNDAGLPPDYMTGRASLGSDAVLVRIEESPKRAIRTDYLDAWLKYGNRVAAEYSFNYVPNRSAFAVLAGPSNAAMVHYSLELDPESFGFASDEEQRKFYTTLDVTLEVRDAEGTLLLANDRSDYLELSPSRVREIERYPIAYQDSFPLVPGRHAISVVFRNRALKRYTVAETALTIPDFSRDAPALAGLVLGYGSERLLSASSENEMRTFQLGSIRIDPGSDSVFAIGDTVTAFAQALRAPSGSRARFELLLGEESIDGKEVPVEGASSGVLAELSTLGATGGTYLVRVRLTGPDGSSLAEQAAPLTLSPRTSVPRPNFVYRRGFNAAVPGLLPLVLGDQWWSLGKYDLALAQYEKSVAAGNHDLPQARWKLAHAYLSRGHTSRAFALLAPLEPSFPAQYEVVVGLGLVFSRTSQDEKAVSYLERALTLRPPEAQVLNALGESYRRLGNPEKARESFQRSLELNPEQPAVREILDGPSQAKEGGARLETRAVPLGESFSLRVGEAARVEDAGITVTFQKVLSDSRCPKDVTCIQAGEAVVSLALDAEEGRSAVLELAVPPGGSSPEATFASLRVAVIELQPQKDSRKAIDPASYVATLRVSPD
jgi:GWxTD domain-containing protein